jgi:glycosyltransferase involved in cell wall biosynthesis
MSRTILIISDNLPGQINGVCTTFTNIEKHAVLDGFIVKFIDPSMFFNFPAIGYPEVKISIPWGISKKIEDANPDYIHIATEGPIGFAARQYCKSKHYHYNTSYHSRFPEFLKVLYGIPESITYRYVRWFHMHSAKVLTTTQTMVDDLKSRGFTADIIPWTRGVDRTHLKAKPRKKSDGFTILYVGRISKEKSIDDLCKIDRTLFDYRIQIVGDGPYRAELEAKYPDIEFIGYKTGVELAEYYANADVMCFPSRTDTFGIVIIESMSMGTPVAAYPVPGPIDIIEQGVTGFVNDNLDDAIAGCLQLNRVTVKRKSNKWTWENCWEIFKNNLVTK